jgi:hypothetical protein
MTILALMFAVGALGLFFGTFSFIAKGRIGTAIAFGVTAVMMAAIAGGLAVAD